ncbi:MAG TPA: MBL fold metallo-hydrolase [Myxococcales bacterium]|jgi:glyoxylase-like metal-dependent hydrolase (beta-lactamase superfamily II)|nr:MBL fold metallo-hydrolase [Myxococcales bacterium]
MAGENAASVMERLGVQRVPVPVPFPEAGGPANIYVIEERGGGVALFDAGIGTHEGRKAIEDGFKALGLSLGDVRRIFVSHGHIDHYGYARAVQEASGAPVFVHPRDHDKVLGHDRTAERLKLYEEYLQKLGAPLDLLEHVGIHWMDARRMARPLEQVEALQPGEKLSFARFDAEVMHLPGHTPGLVCLWAFNERVLFSDDHLLEHVSPNPLVDLEGQREPRHKALVEYLRSIQRVRALDVALVAPGHAEPFAGHVALIDRLLGFYVKRQEKLVGLLRAGPRTPASLSADLFPRVRPQHLYLTLSETMGNLEVMEEQGVIARAELKGQIRFELV